MNRPILLQRTLSMLHDAIKKDTLQHGTTAGCATGHIIAQGLGLENRPNIYGIFWRPGTNKMVEAHWHDLFFLWYDNNHVRHLKVKDYGLHLKARYQLFMSGYTIKEIIKLDQAFEGCEYSSDRKQWNDNGMISLVTALLHIHNVRTI